MLPLKTIVITGTLPLPLHGPGTRTQACRARIDARTTQRNVASFHQEAHVNHSDSRTERLHEDTPAPDAHLGA